MGKSEITQLIKELGVSPKISLGQNFLINQNVIHKIIEKVKSLKPNGLIEVGPGLGALTNELVNLNLPLTLIELDSEFAKAWSQKSLNVIEADALHLDWFNLGLNSNTLLVSNLPYQIGSRILIDRSLGPCEINSMVLMFQKEVATRILSLENSKEYSFLSVMAQVFWDIQVVVSAGPRDFYPVPKVASQVLSFKRKKTDIEAPEFLKFIKKCFLNRRKLLLKNFPAEKELFIASLDQLGYQENVRAQEIKVADYISLYKKLQDGSNGH